MKDKPRLAAVRRMEPGPRREILHGLYRLKDELGPRFANPLVIGHVIKPCDYPWPTVAHFYFAEFVPRHIVGPVFRRTKHILPTVDDPRYNGKAGCRICDERLREEAVVMTKEVAENIAALAPIFVCGPVPTPA